MTGRSKWCIALGISFLFFVSSLVLFLSVRARYDGTGENIQFSADELVYKSSDIKDIVFYRSENNVFIEAVGDKEFWLVNEFLTVLDVPYKVKIKNVSIDDDTIWKFIVQQSGELNFQKDDFVIVLFGGREADCTILSVVDCRDENNIFETGNITIRYLPDLVITSVLINNDEARKQFMETASEEDLIPEVLPYDEDEKI